MDAPWWAVALSGAVMSAVGWWVSWLRERRRDQAQIEQTEAATTDTLADAWGKMLDRVESAWRVRLEAACSEVQFYRDRYEECAEALRGEEAG